MFKPIVFTLIVFTVVLSAINIYSDTTRNDENYPIEYVYLTHEDFQKLLNDLKNLNDTVVDKYVDRLMNAIDRGNYTEANELLTDLKRYMQNQYVNETDADKLRELLTINSVKSIDENGVIIDAEKLINIYREYLKNLNGGEYSQNDQQTLQEMFNYLNKYNKNKTINTDLNKLYENSNINATQNIGSHSLFQPPEFISQNPPNLFIPTIYLNAIIPIFLASIIAVIVYWNRKHLSHIIKLLGREAEKIAYRIGFTGIRASDPIANLCLKWIEAVKKKGYVRNKYETLREFSTIIREDDLRQLGLKVVSLYEERFYGEKTVDQGSLENLRKEVENKIAGIM